MSRIYRQAAIIKQVEEDRAEIGEVDVSPHLIDTCPRWPRESPAGLQWDEGPCPYVSCRHHLYGDVLADGSLRVYHPALDVDQLSETCSIDVALRGSHGFDVIGWLLGITARQACDDFESALRKIAVIAPEAYADAMDRIEPERRSGGLIRTGSQERYDPRADCDDEHDNEAPAGYVPMRETMVEVMGRHREIPRLTSEHLARQYRLPVLAERLYLMLIADAGLRRCSVADITRAYQEASGRATGMTKVAIAIETLVEAGLVACEWKRRGKVRHLISVSLVTTLKSRGECPGWT